MVATFKKFCFICKRDVPKRSRVQIKHQEEGVRTVHRACAAKYIVEKPSWEYYGILTFQKLGIKKE